MPSNVAHVAEVAADPTLGDLPADAAFRMYMKNDKLVFAFNRGGTLTFLTIPLDAATVTWTKSTTAP